MDSISNNKTTTVYGNVPVKLATNNALILAELSKSKTPVFSGKEKPLEREIKQEKEP